MKTVDAVGVTFLICATVLLVLFVGDPDLMDSIITNLNKG